MCGETNPQKSLQDYFDTGLNRQIRRMCEYLDYKVVTLKRIRIMNVKLDMGKGKWRHLTKAELKEINRLVANSSKTHMN